MNRIIQTNSAMKTYPLSQSSSLGRFKAKLREKNQIQNNDLGATMPNLKYQTQFSTTWNL